jgi:hypothetical protein
MLHMMNVNTYGRWCKRCDSYIPYVIQFRFSFVAANPVPLAGQVAQLNPLFQGLNAILASANQPARFQF